VNAEATRERLGQLEETYRALGAQTRYGEFVEQLCERLCGLFDAKACTFSDRATGQSWRFEAGEYAVRSEHPIENTQALDGFREGVGCELDAPFLDGPERYALAPLERGVGEGHECYGWLYLYGARGFSEEERARFEGLAAYTTVVLQNVRLVEHSERLAYSDPLTGLPNRRALEEELLGRLRGKGPLAYVFTDIDDFKAINDTHGHDAGDVALVKFARAMQAAARRSDFVARFAGDEFIALIDGGDPTGFLARVRSSVKRAGLSLSAGWAVFPQEERNAAALHKMADGRLYATKRDSKDRRRTQARGAADAS
jgi:diguanylate cyclase (GGDEF)-like protein